MLIVWSDSWYMQARIWSIHPLAIAVAMIVNLYHPIGNLWESGGLGDDVTVDDVIKQFQREKWFVHTVSLEQERIWKTQRELYIYHCYNSWLTATWWTTVPVNIFSPPTTQGISISSFSTFCNSSSSLFRTSGSVKSVGGSLRGNDEWWHCLAAGITLFNNQIYGQINQITPCIYL